LLMVVFITNIAFILIQFLQLKRKLAKEQQEKENEKLKLIGAIAASTAHEIRNPLTGIKGFVALLSEKYTDEKDRYYFSLIQNEVDRINAIVSELLVVGKPAVPSKEIHSVHDILGEIKIMIESEAQLYQVNVHMQMTEEAAFIQVSRDHLKQIVINLVKNALEAMEEGGELTITVEKTKDQLLLKVRDTGKGIAKDVLKQVYAPFFTTKENGTGLGLVVCKRILDIYGGAINHREQSRKRYARHRSIAIGECIAFFDFF